MILLLDDGAGLCALEGFLEMLFGCVICFFFVQLQAMS